jgi:hypothetical protein
MMDYNGNYMVLNYWMEGTTMYIIRVTDWNGCITECQVTKLPY